MPHPPICKREFMRFCAFRVDDMANMEEIVMCLDRHIDQLSQPCKNVTAFAAHFIEEFHAGCDGSLSTFCPNDIGKPEQGKCIIEHLPSLSQSCLTMVQKVIYLMIRVHEQMRPHRAAGPHDTPSAIPPIPTSSDDFLMTPDMFFPGLLDDEADDSHSMWWMNSQDWKEHHLVMMAAFKGTFLAVIVLVVSALLLKCCCRHLCRRFGCHMKCKGRACASRASASDSEAVEGAPVQDASEYRQFA